MVKLIVADDHQMVREALCEMLVHDGEFSVLAQAADGQGLLDLLNNHAPDVVLLDLQMPNMDGLEALRILKDRHNTVPVVILSAEEQPEKVRASLEAGAKGFIPKNADPRELGFAIHSVMQGKTFVSPTVMSELLSDDGNRSKSKSCLSVLTDRETQILAQLANGSKNRDIAVVLGISTRTVDTHRTNILKKLKVKTNAELTKLAIGAGLVTV